MANQIITIGRQCGSGGHTIGILLARQLGLPFYDKQIVEEEAVRTKLSEAFIQSHRAYFDGGQAVGYGTRFNSPERMGSQFIDQLQQIQAEVLLEAAWQEPCVIVGRCADYVLADQFAILKVFIHSELPYKIDRSAREHGLSRDQAPAVLAQRDRARARLYTFFTEQRWGDAANYDLCLDSGRLGINTCVELIKDTYGRLGG